MTPERLIDDLAHAVADGETVDWDMAETQAGTAGSIVRHLRLVASVAQAQRDVLPEPASRADRWFRDALAVLDEDDSPH
jgi:hypothetical protein